MVKGNTEGLSKGASEISRSHARCDLLRGFYSNEAPEHDDGREGLLSTAVLNAVIKKLWSNDSARASSFAIASIRLSRSGFVRVLTGGGQPSIATKRLLGKGWSIS